MGRDNVTFKFRIDLTQMTVKGREAVKILQDLEKASGGAATGMTRLGSSSAAAGKQSAASAVNFQTATQGMLNLSTAAVQTYTSISNLDRANNRARMSIIAVARASDLLNSKKQRLKELEEQGITSGGKYINMQREISTAVADHTEKLEKQRIEQGAVNDIYMLFATNIANVVISSMQTVVILLGHERSARLAAVLATKLQSSALIKHVTITGISIKSLTLMNLTTKIGIGINIGWTASIKAATVAMIGFTKSNAILIAATAVAVGLLHAYETNFWGLKDAIDGAMGSEKEHITVLEDERAAMDALNSTIDDHSDKIFKLPQTYGQASAQLKKITEQLKESNKVFAEYPNFRPASDAGGNSTASGLSIVFPNAYADSDVPTSLADVNLRSRFTPQTGYGGMGTIKDALRGKLIDPGEGKFNVSGSPTAFTTSGRPMGTAGFKIQESFLADNKKKLIKEIVEMESLVYGNNITFLQAEKIFNSGDVSGLPVDLRKRVSTYFDYEKDIIQRLASGGFVSNVIEDKTTLAGLKQYTPESYALEQHQEVIKEQMKAIADKKETELKIEADSLHVSVDELKRRRKLSEDTVFVPGIGNVDKKQIKKINESRSMRTSLLQGNLSSLPTDTSFDRLVKDSFLSSHKNQYDIRRYSTVGSESGKIYDTKELALLMEYDGWGDNRKAAYDKWGVDIGKAAENYSKADAERFGMYQAAGKAINGQVGGQQYTNLFSSFGGSATEAYQVAPGSIRASADFYARNRMRDSNTNRLNLMGATRVPGIPMDQEGAVVGGFSSQREKDRNTQRIRGIQYNNDRTFAAAFGIYQVASYSSGANRSRGEALQRQAQTIGSALSSAGLSYSTNWARRKQPYVNWVALDYQLAQQQNNSVRAFNNNQYAKAKEINILQQFGENQFHGFAGSLSSLREAVQVQDDKVAAIGLNRTEAFQIIDTSGRGIDEIDARVLWKNRVNNISTGTSVL